jgi:WD40 repeat protein/tRNA A-37 threonylcarbamoyl transferase component Bud32
MPVRPLDTNAREDTPSPRTPAPAIPENDGPITAVLRKPGTGNRVPHAPNWPHVRGYEVLSLIGSGGMGIVYKARQRDLRRVVALKTIRATVLADPVYLQRFYAEAEAVARLQHPNIIQVFEIGTVEAQAGAPVGGPFIALEFVDGGSLAERVTSPQPPHDAARLVEKLARATDAAHRLGVIHRDLKPANVLLTKDGEPKIADFGVAKQMWSECDGAGSRVTEEGTVMGTPEYMAPEQASSAPPTPAVDIYALGVILYQLLTARVPFQAASAVETIELLRSREPVSPRRLRPRLPRDLETICLKCLEKEPDRRYESAEALADDLKRFLEHRPIEARRVGHVEKVGRWCKRDPLAAGSLASVAAIFLASFALVTLSYWRSEKARAELAEQRDEAQRREKAERWERYRADILAAASALQVDNVGGARGALEDSPSEHRNWEWRHLYNRLDLARHVLTAAPFNTVSSHAFSDGARRVAVTTGRTVRVWDTVERREVYAHTAASDVAHVHLSPDGRTLAYRLTDLEVVLTDLDTGKVRAVLRGHERPVHNIDFKADGKQIVTGSDEQSYRIWDVASGQLIRQIPLRKDHLFWVHFSGDGRRMTRAEPDSETLEILDVASEKTLAAIPDGRKRLQCVHLDQHGDRLVTVEAYPSCTLRVWDAVNAHELCALRGHTNAITRFAVSPDGQFIATSSRDQTVGVWDAATGRSLAMLRGHRGSVSRVAFSPDGKRLVSASEDHTIRLWDPHSGDALAVLSGHTAEVLGIEFAADGQTLVSISRDGTIRLWDMCTVESSGVLRGHATFVYSVAYHPDGEHVASASWDGTARIWNVTTGRQTASFAHGDGAIVSSVAFQPSGKLLASRTRNAVFLWDVATGREVHRWKAPGGGWRDTRVTFNHRGDRIASGLRDREIGIWDVESHAEVAVLRGSEMVVRDLACSPDDRVIASVGDQHVRIWDAATGTPLHALAGHRDEGYAVAFNRDGTLLASGATDGTVRLWDTATWREIAVLAHGSNVHGVAFSPNGTRLVSACADNSIRLWDVGTHQEVANLRGHGAYVHQAAFSPDGTRLVSASGDRTLRIWDTLSAHDRAAK